MLFHEFAPPPPSLLSFKFVLPRRPLISKYFCHSKSSHVIPYPPHKEQNMHLSISAFYNAASNGVKEYTFFESNS
jgi:hypothetical protein